jgi:integrase
MHLSKSIETKERALEIAKRRMEKTWNRGLEDEPGAPAAPRETFEAWTKRWLKERETRDLTTVDDDRSRLTKWVYAKLGPKRMTAIVRRDLEVLVEDLDRAVRAHKLEWKTAGNVWGTVRKAFDDACHAKATALRVLEGKPNPAEGVRGPDRGAEKAKVYLLPREFLTLVSCEKVPLRWRRMYALACYTYSRAGELRALDWPDINFDGGFIHIHKSLTEKGTTKPTKTKETRKIPIEPNLLPLLRAMHAEAKGTASEEPTGRVLTIPQKKAAQELRDHLKRAGVTRADLFADDESRKPLLPRRGARDGRDLDGAPRGRPAPHPAPTRPRRLRHDADLHPRGRGPRSTEGRRAVPAPARLAARGK